VTATALDPFDPREFAVPRRLHPLTPVLDVIVGARGLLLPLAAMVVAGGWQLAALGAIVVLGAVALGFRLLAWSRFSYSFDGEALRVEQGVLERKVQTVPAGRIQQVDVRAKLRHRLANVVELRFDTAAGGDEAEVTLSVIDAGEADRLRRVVLARRDAAVGTATAPGGPAGGSAGASTASSAGVEAGVPAPPAAPAEVPERVLVRVGVGRLAVSGMTGARLAAVLAIVGAVVGVLDDVPDSVVDRVVDALPQGVAAAIAAAILIGPVWLGLAAASAILTDYGFTLTERAGEFRVRRGLLDRRETTVARRRVQAVRIDQSLLRRLLGFASVVLQSAGGGRGADSEVARVTIPLVRVGELDVLVGELAPGLGALPPLRPAPPAARRRAIVRRAGLAALVLALPLVLVAVLAPVSDAAATGLLVTAALAVVAGAGAGELAYRGLGHALVGDHLVTRRGGLLRHTVVVPVAKAQSARLRSSFFQRRAGLATLVVDVAGRGREPAVPEVEAGRLAGLQRAVLAAPELRADEAQVRRRLQLAAARS
jgi:putative membrane protein